MTIKEKEVLVKYSGKTIEYYESKGYEFPKWVNRYQLKYKSGSEILIKIEDLFEQSKAIVTKICDTCGSEKPTKYFDVINSRKRRKTNIDLCIKCLAKIKGKEQIIADIDNCIANTNPELAKLLWNIEDSFKYKSQSNEKADFRCPFCNNNVGKKVINNIYKSLKVPCPCNDGISFPEKFMFNVLTQLNVKFDFQKCFKWSKSEKNGTRPYDFYLIDYSIIVETHGNQHYKRGFETIGGRTLEEEQENDKIKKELACENGITKYIEIYCRVSETNFIKNNIMNSELNLLFDFSKIEWYKCFEFALNSLVKKACDLYNEEKSPKEICDILKLSKNTINRYLNQGTKLNFCNYDPCKMKKISNGERNKKLTKPVIQLSLQGEFIREWESCTEIAKKLNSYQANISLACRNKNRSACGFKWAYKEDYIS